VDVTVQAIEPSHTTLLVRYILANRVIAHQMAKSPDISEGTKSDGVQTRRRFRRLRRNLVLEPELKKGPCTAASPKEREQRLSCIPIRDTLYPMAYKATTIEDLLGIMKRVQGEKTLTQFAAELDLSKQYLCNVYNRRKEPSQRLLDKLGFARETTYFRSPTAARKEKKK